MSPDAATVFPDATLRYKVTLHEIRLASDGGTQIVALFEGNTTQTSYDVPGTNMAAGGRYVVAVEAALTTEALAAPLHAWWSGRSRTS